MVRILLVIGTRPEAIKMAPVYHELKKNATWTVALCNTGQHRDLCRDALEFFQIKPDFDLDIMKPDQHLDGLLATVISKMHNVLYDFKPTHVIVQGDTTTVLGSALVSFQNKAKVIHLEAGLRSGDMRSPFPEEMNRVLTSKLSSLHFAPTERAVKNLNDDGVQNGIHLVGNTVIDALIWAKERIELNPRLLSETILSLSSKIPFERALLVTTHRRENFGDPLMGIISAIKVFSAENSDIPILFPVHPNPNVKNIVYQTLGKEPNVYLLDPLDYPDLVYVMANCYAIMTDSGGIQEEAPTFGKPVLVLRENTERQEGLESGSAILVGSNKTIILEQLKLIYNDPAYYLSFSRNQNPYGDGQSAKRISRILSQG